MPESFGARLKAQRERQGVTLDAIAEQTKIRAALLEGLERGDLSAWPPGIFRRSYLRDYATAIGLNPETTVREFLALYPDPVEDPEAVLEATAAAAEAHGRRPPTRLQYLIASAIGVMPRGFAAKARPGDVLALSDPELPRAVPVAREEETHTDPIPMDTSPAAVPAEIEAAADPAAVIAQPAAPEAPVSEPADATAVPTENDDQQLHLPGIEEQPSQFDLQTIARLCTQCAQVGSARDLDLVLEEAAPLLRAVGIIVWPWDAGRGVLWPSHSYGYPRQVMAKLPAVPADAANPIGAAFRSASCQLVNGNGAATGAIVAPIMTPLGCGGVLAVECTSGLEKDSGLQALVAILAAQLSPRVSAESLSKTAIA